MENSYIQAVHDFFETQEIRRQRIYRITKIFSLVFLVCAIIFLWTTSIPFFAAFTSTFITYCLLVLLITSPLNTAYTRILKLAIKGITEETAGNGWEYSASYNLASYKATVTPLKFFPFWRTRMTNYVLRGQWKTMPLLIVGLSLMKSGNRRRDSRYDFDGHLFTLSGTTSCAGIILTNTKRKGYFKIPRGYLLNENYGISAKDILIYTKHGSNNTDANRVLPLFQKLMTLAPDAEILWMMESTTQTVAINDKQFLFEQNVVINKKVNPATFVENTDKSIHYLIDIVKVISDATP